MSCHAILGPMAVGKTTELVKRLSVENATGARVICINHIKDERCGKNEISTHSVILNTKVLKCIKLERLADFSDIANYDVIGIEEAQFFPDIDQFVRKWVLENRKMIIISALTGDFKLGVFGEVYKLLPLFGPNITSLTGRCVRCLAKGKSRFECIGGYTSLKAHEMQVGDSNVIIGGTDIYETLCLDCYIEQNK